MAEEKSKRRWFRFSLRASLAVVTLAAVGSWVWTSMPLWIKGREQLDFEKSVRTIKAGMAVNKAGNLPLKPRDSLYSISDTQGNHIWLARYDWPNAIYCISYVMQPRGGRETDIIKSVEIFRLPAVSPDYKAQTKRGIWTVASNTQPAKPADAQMRAYMADFLDFVCSDHKNDPGVPYELIYSDPPTKPRQ